MKEHCIIQGTIFKQNFPKIYKSSQKTRTKKQKFYKISNFLVRVNPSSSKLDNHKITTIQSDSSNILLPNNNRQSDSSDLHTLRHKIN